MNKLVSKHSVSSELAQQLVDRVVAKAMLNKARLYRYMPVVPTEQRHPVPLLLIFALMNRPCASLGTCGMKSLTDDSVR